MGLIKVVYIVRKVGLGKRQTCIILIGYETSRSGGRFNFSSVKENFFNNATIPLKYSSSLSF